MLYNYFLTIYATLMLNYFSISSDVIQLIQHYINAHQLKSNKIESLRGLNQISYEQWWSLLDEVQSLSNCDTIGLSIGNLATVEGSGILAYLCRTSVDLSAALTCFQRFERLLYNGSQTKVSVHQDQVTLSWSEENGLSSRISDELLLATLVKIMRDILSPYALSPAHISFTHTLNEDQHSAYYTYFCCPISVAQKQLSISFNAKDLRVKIPQYDAQLNGLLGLQAENQLQQVKTKDLLSAQIADILYKQLPHGRSSASAIAQELQLSERTLHRKLRQRGELYRNILKTTRKCLAHDYIADPKLSFVEIALLLGYSEQSAFNRAFKSWYGLSPLQYRSSTF